jgi:hypothetical protein
VQNNVTISQAVSESDGCPVCGRDHTVHTAAGVQVTQDANVAITTTISQ